MKPLLFLSEALLVQRDAFPQTPEAADEDCRMQDMTRFRSGGESGASDGDALLSSEGCRVRGQGRVAQTHDLNRVLARFGSGNLSSSPSLNALPPVYA
ncbi:hypothetical protein ARMGADRAFT_1089749 [Armillaria gallica]|uniref:Uncharacterized protein n=1 Tax=Armillaria gallica TaxID=47427 RepID=A0A2H3D1W1_ARMGA|nr:hypothetical protein ARMGADRAFT_1089749 [Armillaria gallica]